MDVAYKILQADMPLPDMSANFFKEFPKHLKSIAPELFFIGVPFDGMMIAGGFIRDFFTGDRPRDIDVFFKSHLDYNYFRQETDLKIDKEDPFVINYRHDPPIQVVKHYLIPPEELVMRMGLTIGRILYDCSTERLYVDKDFFRDFKEKKLRLTSDVRTPYPMSLMQSAFKYAGKGFQIDKETILELSRQLIGKYGME
jgi:hypothetical protein